MPEDPLRAPLLERLRDALVVSPEVLVADGTTTEGTPARVAECVVPEPPWWTTSEGKANCEACRRQRRNGMAARTCPFRSNPDKATAASRDGGNQFLPHPSFIEARHAAQPDVNGRFAGREKIGQCLGRRPVRQRRYPLSANMRIVRPIAGSRHERRRDSIQHRVAAPAFAPGASPHTFARAALVALRKARQSKAFTNP